MTQYKITVNKNILHHLLSSNDEGMKELLKQILDQILEQQNMILYRLYETGFD
jgi:uncharacterized membrane-anchored protein